MERATPQAVDGQYNSEQTSIVMGYAPELHRESNGGDITVASQTHDMTFFSFIGVLHAQRIFVWWLTI
jgi:hypothetical protein